MDWLTQTGIPDNTAQSFNSPLIKTSNIKLECLFFVVGLDSKNINTLQFNAVSKNIAIDYLLETPQSKQHVQTKQRHHKI